MKAMLKCCPSPKPISNLSTISSIFCREMQEHKLEEQAKAVPNRRQQFFRFFMATQEQDEAHVLKQSKMDKFFANFLATLSEPSLNRVS
jgi:hypothetical protein